MTVHDRRSTDTLAAGQYVPVEIDDPYEPGSSITVLRQLRGDPLGRLHSHRQIDDAQFVAGRHYQRVWEQTECGARAVDPTKEKVDGGLLPEAFRESRRRAALDLSSAAKALGRDNSSIVNGILARGLSVEELAMERGTASQWKMRVLGKKFRDSLEILAVHWGYAGESHAQSR